MSRSRTASQSETGASTGAPARAAPAAAHTGGDEDDPVLAETKNALFGSRARSGRGSISGSGSGAANGSGTASHRGSISQQGGGASTTAASQSESEAAEHSRLSRETDATLQSLSDAMKDNDDGSDSLDLTTRGDRDALSALSIDFDETSGADLRKFLLEPAVQSALSHRGDPRQTLRETEEQLAIEEALCIEDYLRDGDSLSALHTQLKSCDLILSTMETMLSHFQSDLSAVSAEIQSLQEKSLHMNVRLRNSKAAEKQLHRFISEIFIPDDLANVVLDGEINETFVAALEELDKKLTAIKRLNQQEARGGPSQSLSLPASLKEMSPLGEKLKLKAIARIRAFLLERFHSLKKPKTNIQIKQKSLIKFAPLYQFLLHHADEAGRHSVAGGTGAAAPAGGYHHPPLSSSHSSSNLSSTAGGTPSSAAISADICGEIRREYHETISVIYAAKFKKYLTEMKRLQADRRTDKSDTLGNEDGASGGGSAARGGGGAGGASGGGSLSVGSMLSGLFGGKKSAQDLESVFRLGNRHEVLQGAQSGSQSSVDPHGGIGAAGDGDLIVPHVASASGAKIPFERIFKSSQTLLMDTATSEYDFIVEFFGEIKQREMDSAGQKEEEVDRERQEEAEAASGGGAGGDSAAAAADRRAAAGGHYTGSHLDERGREHLAPHSRDKHLFSLVFNKTISLFLDNLSDFLATCHDALTVLLLIRIVCQHNIAMQCRRVHCLDSTFDRMNMTMWPKFKAIFDANVESVMKVPFCDIRPGRVKPHYIPLRYAEFASGILTLNIGYNDDILIANLKRLRGEVDKFLIRSAGRVSPPKHLSVFLLTNYTAIRTILHTHGHDQSDDGLYWQDACAKQVAAYVDEELREKFPRLIAYVIASESAHASSLPAAEAKELVDEFKRRWKEGVEAMHQTVIKNFAQEADVSGVGGGGGAAAAAGKSAAAAAAAAAGGASASSAPGSSSVVLFGASDIFREVLVQLVLYYQRFQTLITTHFDKGSKVREGLVAITEMYIEIKKYK